MEIKNNKNESFTFSKRVSLVDKYNFYEYMSVLVDGGIGVTESLNSVGSKIKSTYFRQKIREMITFVSSGDSFSKSMKKIPDVFSASEISIIESGEAVGRLSHSLSRLSENLKKNHELKSKIIGALTYPTIIFLFLITAIFIVMIYVIPAMRALFEDVGMDLPFSTQALLIASDFFSNNFLIILLFLGFIILGFILFLSTDSGKISVEKIILSLPLLGRVYRNYILSNSSSTLGNLIGSGISVVKSIQLTGKTSGSLVYENLFYEISEEIEKGEKIAKSVEEVDKENEYFPRDFLQMLVVGETSASLEDVTKKLSIQYEKEVDYSLVNMVKWIEPLALLLAGIFVAWFVFAIFGAIMQITQAV